VKFLPRSDFYDRLLRNYHEYKNFSNGVNNETTISFFSSFSTVYSAFEYFCSDEFAAERENRFCYSRRCVGDAPIIGAGTFADNNTCAVSATGWGEYFIRLGVARDISALMEYKGMTVQKAADLVIHTKLQNAGGDGGIIAIDKNGNIAPILTQTASPSSKFTKSKNVKIRND